MATSSNVFVDQQFNWITLMARESVSDEKCICFTIGQIKLVDEYLKEGANKTMLVKRLVGWALQHFNSMPQFKSDVRMLHLWKLLGKYSAELKMGGVMQRLNDLGFFNLKTEFYLMWAGHWAEQRNRNQFNRVVQICRQNCKLSSAECDELFEPLLKQSWPTGAFNKEDTDSITAPVDDRNSMGEAENDLIGLHLDKIQSSDSTLMSYSATRLTFDEMEMSKESPSPVRRRSTRRNASKMLNKSADVISKKKAAAMADDRNPWDPSARQKILSTAALPNLHAFPNEVGPAFALWRTVDLGSKSYQIVQLLGTGGFGKIYRALTDFGKVCALKYQEPPCPWEIYICGLLKRRLPAGALHFVMQVQDAYLFSSASVIVYDYYSHGSLLDLSNHYKKKGQEIGGFLVAFFAIQLAQLLEQLHKAKIIHADVKPDNLMINTSYFALDTTVKGALSRPAVKLIDWGRAIDMQQYPDGHEFFGRAGTKSFDCTEMIFNKPWNYQTDFFGFIATIHVLIFKEYMQTVNSEGRIKQMKVIKRRIALRPMWLLLFDELLNIPSCRSLPSWPDIHRRMLKELAESVQDDPLEWKNTLDRYNKCF